jgi:hypothetical protein
MNLQLLQEVFELNQAFERIIEALKRMEKVRFLQVAMVRETRVEVPLAQIDFNRQFFDEFDKDYEKDERWACEFKRECEDGREDPEDAYLEIKEREEARQKKVLPPRVTFLPDWDGGDPYQTASTRQCEGIHGKGSQLRLELLETHNVRLGFG